MADVKIASLTAKTTWADTDLVIVEDGADTKKMTVATLKTLLSDITGGQLKFPATQNPSADVNTLDDYEETNYNPTDLSAAVLTFTYTNQGRYIKVGRLVTLWFDITYPTTASSAASYISLPFTVEGMAIGVIGYHSIGTAVLMYGQSFYDVGGNVYTNAQLSGKRIAGVITFRANA